jgi:exopolysaccharide biosynthesis polyprenyl glycosylphosphotransferase
MTLNADLTWNVLAIAFGGAAIALILLRVLAGVSVQRLEALINGQHILFVGLNQRTLAAYEYFKRTKKLGKVVGFVDSDARSTENLPYLGNFEILEKTLGSSVVDSVVIGLPMRSHYDVIRRVIDLCENQGITVHYLLDPFTSFRSATKIGVGRGWTTLTMHTAPITGLQLYFKHLFDKLFAAFMLFLVSPLLFLAALSIKLEDGGPIFFTQERVGYNKRQFKMLKLRTMLRNAEAMTASLEKANESDGAGFKIQKDPRITRTGRILRKFSIDELPQLLNVVKGDMSIVGPRPLSLRDYGKLPMDWQRRRFSMRPGLTCYWQVRGRHRLTFSRWMKLDLEYIDNWNLLEDFKTIIATVPEVLRGGGA